MTRATVAERLAVISNESGLDSVNGARATLWAFYAWLIGNGTAEPSSVIGTIETLGEEAPPGAPARREMRR